MTAHVCRVCGARRRPGGFLLVTPVDGEPFHVCRPSVIDTCFAKLRLRRADATISLDPDEARRYDLERAGGPAPDPVATAIHEARVRGFAKDRNARRA